MKTIISTNKKAFEDLEYKISSDIILISTIDIEKRIDTIFNTNDVLILHWTDIHDDSFFKKRLAEEINKKNIQLYLFTHEVAMPQTKIKENSLFSGLQIFTWSQIKSYYPNLSILQKRNGFPVYTSLSALINAFIYTNTNEYNQDKNNVIGEQFLNEICKNIVMSQDNNKCYWCNAIRNFISDNSYLFDPEQNEISSLLDVIRDECISIGLAQKINKYINKYLNNI